ncbi:MAG: hydantoinase B/oxoprolinase family protein [Rhodobacteraceae bacterium]|nr:hydantoinase B/oxoprolinase family protein [Paracoccaceae bacterium]
MKLAHMMDGHRASKGPLADQLARSERLFASTGHYAGLEDLELRQADPLRFETVHMKLRAFCVSAREMARRISASPGVREVGEMVVALYTPEGDAVALSNGIMVHVHTMSRFIKWMIRNEYEGNPGIAPGDIFANNDAFIGTVQVPDVMDVIPIFHEGRLIAWAGAVCHELEAGGITPGGDVALAQERYAEGLFVCAEKIGVNDTIRRDYVIRCERNLRMPIYWVLDEQAKVAACIYIREQLLELVADIGAETLVSLCREFIEEGRRSQLARTRQLTVPGTYRGHAFYGHITSGKPGFQALGDPDWLYAIPIEMTIGVDGKIMLDFEGAQPWGYHSMNCTPAGMDGGMFVTLTQHMNYEGMVNAGAWLATELRLPPGSWTNPDRETCATATSWALLLPAFGVFQRLLSRGFLARGFVEEVFVGQVNSPMIEMGGINQHGDEFGIAHFECAAAGSGALAIKDGLDTAYVGWNPESDMGNVEIWEQEMPLLYLGRSILPNSGGAGRFRGGNAFLSTWLVSKTDELRLVTSEHSSRVFDNAGMCGGYPAPTCQVHRTVRNSNIAQRARNRLPLVHDLGPGQDRLASRLDGIHEQTEGPFIAAPMKSGDIFTHSYNGGGGYGDPLARCPKLTLTDMRNGHSSRRHAEVVHGIRFLESSESELAIDWDATKQARKSMLRNRLERARPVSAWLSEERQRVMSRDFVPEVRKMYAAAMRLSPRFAAEFRQFWSLPSEFSFEDTGAGKDPSK